MALFVVFRREHDPLFTNDEDLARNVAALMENKELLFARYLKLEKMHEQIMAENKRLLTDYSKSQQSQK